MKRVGSNIVWLLLFCAIGPLSAGAQEGTVLSGVVRDLQGSPQMGALIELLGPDATVIARTFTDDHGRYLLSSLRPGEYQLRASATFLLPALRSNLRLNPGVHALANLTLTALFEVGVWFPAEKRSSAEPRDDWRWTLRSTANRPLLRLDDQAPGSANIAGEQTHKPAMQGDLAVRAGAGAFGDGGTQQIVQLDRSSDVGSTEALRCQLAEAGDGDGDAGSLSLSAGYERHTATGGTSRMVAGLASRPEITTPDGNSLQTISLATTEQMTLGDAVMIDAGTLFLAEHLAASRAQAAPFVRVVVAPAPGVAVMYRMASSRDLQSSSDLNNLEIRPIGAADAKGRPTGLRDLHQEVAISRSVRGSVETLPIYQDNLGTGLMEGSGVLGGEAENPPVLEDGATHTFRVGTPGYVARGIEASYTRAVTPAIAASLAADLGTALVRGSEPLGLMNLGTAVHARLSPAVTASVEGKLVRTATDFKVQYRWQGGDTLDMVNAFDTPPQKAFLSFYLKQRLWSGGRLRGMDAVLEATNLLEEGYQPMVGADGRTLFLTQAPRTLQAGLSFNF